MTNENLNKDLTDKEIKKKCVKVLFKDDADLII